ncbi:MAG: hypothetical protein B7Z37_16965 [Verrucomicrobia bacterium 12-59-8]|nr:MAG: hypothetical protein B7Z37_16965 [Verrucomicrobia bacterium 12-59-8]
MKELLPGQAASMESLFSIARSTLNNTTADINERAHAQCWLTYRFCDGLIDEKEWRNQVNNFSVQSQKARWATSLATAKFYAYVLLDEWDNAKEQCDIVHAVPIKDHPPAITNRGRIVTILARHQASLGETNEAVSACRAFLSSWKETCASIDLEATPVWLVDSQAASMAAAHAALRILAEILPVPKFPNVEWCDNLIKGYQTTPWWKCILRNGGPFSLPTNKKIS